MGIVRARDDSCNNAAHQHRRYGVGRIYRKRRQAAALVNHKRVERLYTEARLQIRRGRRKQIPVVDRQLLVRPQAPNEAWSVDFIFDRTADGGVVARIVTGPHDANRQDPHLPMRYDTGRPRAVIRLRISQPRTTSLPSWSQPSRAARQPGGGRTPVAIPATGATRGRVRGC